jgi:hypothetical protein
MKRTIQLITRNIGNEEEQKIITRVDVMMRECFPTVSYEIKKQRAIICPHCGTEIVVHENWGEPDIYGVKLSFEKECEKCGAAIIS